MNILSRVKEQKSIFMLEIKQRLFSAQLKSFGSWQEKVAACVWQVVVSAVKISLAVFHALFFSLGRTGLRDGLVLVRIEAEDAIFPVLSIHRYNLLEL